MNWTGIGLEISREVWEDKKNRKELDQAGIYILLVTKRVMIFRLYILGKGMASETE